jgi:hypothetical protein
MDKGLARRLLDLAVTVAASVWLLGWAWSRLKGLLPILTVSAALFVLGRLALRHYRRW